MSDVRLRTNKQHLDKAFRPFAIAGVLSSLSFSSRFDDSITTQYDCISALLSNKTDKKSLHKRVYEGSRTKNVEKDKYLSFNCNCF